MNKEKIISKPNSLIKIRNTFHDKENINFIQKDFPLMHISKKILPIKKNFIILMFELLPSSSIYALSKNSDFQGTYPFFCELIKKSL